MSDIIKSLNPKQQEAALYNDGPLAIIAGAGSGKTRTITHKIAHLIKDLKVKPYRILAVTFTNKAANEMKERVVKLVGKQGNDVNVFTYHAFCAKILRQEIDAIGFKKSFNIIDPVDQRQILRPGYRKFGLSYRTVSYNSVISMISKFKNSNLSPKEIMDDATKDIDKAYANLYEYYLEQTFISNSLDFDDLLIFTEKLFQEHKDIAKKWSDKFNYVMVDEFQDTSTTQYNIIKSISKNSIFTVVGDPDQNIYTWRYADPKLIINFQKKHKKGKIILLEQNYRSTKKILSAANKLISNNKNRIPKNLFTNNKEGAELEYYHGFSDDSEARWVVEKIRGLMIEGNKPNDIAILYRSNFLSNAIEKALIKNNLNYIIYGSIKFYQREEIKDVVAFLKVINNGDAVSFKRIINTPTRALGATSQEKIFSFIEKFSGDFFENIIKHFEEIDIKPKQRKELANLLNLIRKYQIALKTNSIESVIQKFLIESSYEKKWSSFEDQGRVENIKQFIKNINDWEKDNNKKDLNDFINEISLYVDRDNEELDTREAISLMTIHSSKGLEFKHVFVYGVSESIFPSKRTMDETLFNGIEEERRLAYVAVTRAMERLYITSSRGFSIDFSTQKTPSRFIKELGIDLAKVSKHYIFEKPSTKAKINNHFIEGDKINHHIFGAGIIMSVEGKIVQIAFKSPHGVKSMMKNHPSLKREGE